MKRRLLKVKLLPRRHKTKNKRWNPIKKIDSSIESIRPIRQKKISLMKHSQTSLNNVYVFFQPPHSVEGCKDRKVDEKYHYLDKRS